MEEMYKRREKGGITFLKKRISCLQTVCMGKCISGIHYVQTCQDSASRGRVENVQCPKFPFSMKQKENLEFKRDNICSADFYR